MCQTTLQFIIGNGIVGRGYSTSRTLRMFVIIIIIMEICKAPTLRLKALNKHSITHIMNIEMEMLSVIKMYIKKKKKKLCEI